jgi:gamma-glutamylcyclotransferase (GGCT)/AIG2-like uncharacterized protein YtfP
MGDRVFFYGTLMSGFNRRLRTGIDPKLAFVGRGSIQAALFDLGIYPAAVPGDGRVRGEVFETDDPVSVLAGLDSIEGYRSEDPERSLYTRVQTPVTLDDGQVVDAWVYFYNAPLGQAMRIPSGDYLQHLEQDKRGK